MNSTHKCILFTFVILIGLLALSHGFRVKVNENMYVNNRNHQYNGVSTPHYSMSNYGGDLEKNMVESFTSLPNQLTTQVDPRMLSLYNHGNFAVMSPHVVDANKEMTDQSSPKKQVKPVPEQGYTDFISLRKLQENLIDIPGTMSGLAPGTTANSGLQIELTTPQQEDEDEEKDIKAYQQEIRSQASVLESYTAAKKSNENQKKHQMTYEHLLKMAQQKKKLH